MDMAFVVDLDMEMMAVTVYIVVEVDLTLYIVFHLDPQGMMYLAHYSVGIS